MESKKSLITPEISWILVRRRWAVYESLFMAWVGYVKSAMMFLTPTRIFWRPNKVYTYKNDQCGELHYTGTTLSVFEISI